MEVASEQGEANKQSFTLKDGYVALQHLSPFKTSFPDFLLVCIADLYNSKKLDFQFYLNSEGKYARFSERDRIVSHRELSNLAVTAELVAGQKGLNFHNKLERLISKYVAARCKCVDIVFTSYQVDQLENALANEYDASKLKIEAANAFVDALRLYQKCRTPVQEHSVLTDFKHIEPEVMLERVAHARIILNKHDSCELFARQFQAFYENDALVLQPFGLRGRDLALSLLLRQIGLESRCGEFTIIE